MPTASAITINDSVPTARVFTPVEASAGKTVMLDRDSNLTSAGSALLQIGFSPTRSSRPTDKVTGRLQIPHEVTIDSVTTVRDVAIGTFSHTLPEGMTATERANFQALFENMVAHALVAAYTSDLDTLW